MFYSELYTFLSALPPNLAEREPYVWEFLLEGFVHVLLEVRGFDVFDDRGLKRKTRGGVKMTTLSALGSVTGSSHTRVGFHRLTMRLYRDLVLLMSLKRTRLVIFYIFFPFLLTNPVKRPEATMD